VVSERTAPALSPKVSVHSMAIATYSQLGFLGKTPDCQEADGLKAPAHDLQRQ
jgi:hypothetical protein